MHGEARRGRVKIGTAGAVWHGGARNCQDRSGGFWYGKAGMARRGKVRWRKARQVRRGGVGTGAEGLGSERQGRHMNLTGDIHG